MFSMSVLKLKLKKESTEKEEQWEENLSAGIFCVTAASWAPGPWAQRSLRALRPAGNVSAVFQQKRAENAARKIPLVLPSTREQTRSVLWVTTI